VYPEPAVKEVEVVSVFPMTTELDALGVMEVTEEVAWEDDELPVEETEGVAPLIS